MIHTDNTRTEVHILQLTVYFICIHPAWHDSCIHFYKWNKPQLDFLFSTHWFVQQTCHLTVNSWLKTRLQAYTNNTTDDIRFLIWCKWSCGRVKGTRKPRRTTCTETKTKTHSQSRAGWDVRGTESEYSPPGPNVEALTVSLQQQSAVVDCRGLKTLAAPKTWGEERKGELRSLINVSFFLLL